MSSIGSGVGSSSSGYSNPIFNMQPQVSGNIIKVLWRQQQELLTKHPDGVVMIPTEDPLDIQANIEGPKSTPYEGGLFRVKIVIPNDFPQAAPKGYFVTKIYHPNVSDKGEICVNTLKKDWTSKGWSLFHVLEVLIF
jgi:ubiquitin-conjugating enzyme E2 S